MSLGKVYDPQLSKRAVLPCKSRKTSRSSRSSGGLQSPDYPTLPLTISTEALQQNSSHLRTKFSKNLFSKHSLKGFNLLGLRKASHRRFPIPASRSCEDLDGPCQRPGPWRRSHSLGDIRLEQSNAEFKATLEKARNDSPQKLNGTAIIPKTRPPVPSQLPLRSSCPSPQSPTVPELLSSPPTSPFQSTGDKIIAKTHSKKPPVPPPVPAKKSRDRLANGLRHAPLSLPSSPSPTHSMNRSHPSSPVIRSTSSSPGPPLPAKTPTSSTPASPCYSSSASSVGEESAGNSSAQPPWLSDLGGKVAVARKASHSKMIPDLLSVLEQRLEAEGIDLTEEPYSDKHGRCGIPQLLVQRYSEEAEQPLKDVASSLDQLRVRELRKQHRMAIPSGGQTEISRKLFPVGHISSVSDWLVSIGLPMYASPLAAAGVVALAQVTSLTESSVWEAGVRDERHVRRLVQESRLVSPDGGS
uniref:SAM domain-containing protein n=1 Tax=Knipowitschia caucasica TaxID=637954 RepID=A0AAV2KBT6_KNICA